jgi:hypothetical protein
VGWPPRDGANNQYHERGAEDGADEAARPDGEPVAEDQASDQAANERARDPDKEELGPVRLATTDQEVCGPR